MDLVKRRQVLINLISRVGRGQQNIYRWVDELMEIDVQLEGEKMFKINARDLHPTIQKKLNKILNGSLVDGIIATAFDPDGINWEEIEIAIYGSVDTDCDRLFQCVSWGEDETSPKIIKEAEAKVTAKNTVADELHQLNLTFEDLKNPAKLGLAGLISVPFKDKDKSYHNKLNLPQECQGLPAFSTGNTRRSQTSTHSTNRMGDSVSHKTWVTECEYVIGTYLYWSDTNIEGKILFPSEAEILKKEVDHLVNIILNNGVKTLAEAQELSAKRLAKIADEKAAKLAIPKPEWVEKEITSNGNVNRFWIGDDYIYSFWWNSQDGTVWQQCEDRTRGERTRESKSLGSNRDVVMNHINSLLAERKRVSELLAAQEEIKHQQEKLHKEQYQEYKALQKSKGGIVKPFEKWVQSVA
jgi:hypothetical protein